jgi:hypothetical protein
MMMISVVDHMLDKMQSIGEHGSLILLTLAAVVVLSTVSILSQRSKKIKIDNSRHPCRNPVFYGSGCYYRFAFLETIKDIFYNELPT